jgi:hypothetical protein
MADRLVIDVFCEDSGHETYLRNLIKVLASSAALSTPAALTIRPSCLQAMAQ